MTNRVYQFPTHGAILPVQKAGIAYWQFINGSTGASDSGATGMLVGIAPDLVTPSHNNFVYNNQSNGDQVWYFGSTEQMRLLNGGGLQLGGSAGPVMVNQAGTLRISLASSNFTFPAGPPGSTQIMSMDSSGNIAAQIGVDGTSIILQGGTTLKVGTVPATSLPTANIGLSASSGAYNNNFGTGGESGALITTSTINCSGNRPVLVMLVDDGAFADPSGSAIGLTGGGAGSAATFRIYRDNTTKICSYRLDAEAGTDEIYVPPGAVSVIESSTFTGLTAGNHSWSLRGYTHSNVGAFWLYYVKLIAVEL